MLSRMSSNDRTRAGDVARIRRVLERLHSPRLQMMFIVSLTGAVGFLTSVGLLRAGMDSTAARYSLAVAAAYLVFLFFLWCWLRFKAEDFDPTGDLANWPDLVPSPEGSFERAEATSVVAARRTPWQIRRRAVREAGALTSTSISGNSRSSSS